MAVRELSQAVVVAFQRPRAASVISTAVPMAARAGATGATGGWIVLIGSGPILDRYTYMDCRRWHGAGTVLARHCSMPPAFPASSTAADVGEL
jgi:hypothetical protein